MEISRIGVVMSFNMHGIGSERVLLILSLSLFIYYNLSLKFDILGLNNCYILFPYWHVVCV